MLVKMNHPGLYQELKDWFDHPHVWRSLDLRTAKQVSKGHGRVETRQITVSAACRYLDWPDMEQVMLFEKRVVHTRTGEIQTSQTYAITSLSPLQAVRHVFCFCDANIGRLKTDCTIHTTNGLERMPLASVPDKHLV